MSPEELAVYKEKVDNLTETVGDLKDTLTHLTATIDRLVVVGEALEGLAKTWTRASGGIWILKKLLTFLGWIGATIAAVAAGAHGMDYLKIYLTKGN